MIAYPDTSFLCAFYRKQANSAEAARHFARMPEALHVTSPLLFEFRQSIRWQTFLHQRDRSKGYDRPTANAALASLNAELATGAVVVVPVDWADLVSIGERLSAQYTWTEGYRGSDRLHPGCATRRFPPNGRI